MNNSIEKDVSSVQIGAMTDQVPMGIQTASLGGLNLIVPEKTMDHLDDYR